MDPIVILYCTGILSNLLANNQMNKEFLFSRGAIPTLYRVLISSYSIPATTPNQQQRVEDIQVLQKKFTELYKFTRHAFIENILLFEFSRFFQYRYH